MLRTYRWQGAFWRFEDGRAPEGAVLVEATKPVTAETPRKRRTTKARPAAKPKE